MVCQLRKFNYEVTTHLFSKKYEKTDVVFVLELSKKIVEKSRKRNDDPLPLKKSLVNLVSEINIREKVRIGISVLK